MKGVGKGFVGLFVKPVVGMTDLVGDTLKGASTKIKKKTHVGEADEVIIIYELKPHC